LLDQTIPSSEIEIIVADNTIDLEVANANKELCRMDPDIKYIWTADKTIITGPHFRCLYTATEIGVEMATGEWLGFPNQDTAHVPVFAERMIKHGDDNNLQMVYCDFVLGGPELAYGPRQTNATVCNVDKTGIIVKRSCFSGFKNKTTDYSCADGHFVQKLAESGIRHGRLAEYLVMHN
jgi:hypothetical protein